MRLGGSAPRRLGAVRRFGGSVVRVLVAGCIAGVLPTAASSVLAGQAGTTPSRRAAEPPSRRTEPPGSELSISVMTMGVGALVWERFGHNAIIVEDRSRGTSTAYNYGMFSFRQENFLLRFLQGRMTYWMAAYPTAGDIPRYVAARRSVWRQELNLTPAQRIALRDYLQINALPENRFYRYDYYLDNCSTRVRDALDHALGGAIQAQMQGPASASFRYHTQRLNTHNIPLYTGLLLALGHGADRPVTRWDEMFLPLKLREYLDDVRVTDSAGRDMPLVIAEETVFESQAHPVPAAPPVWWPGYLAVGVALGATFWWAAGAGRQSGAARTWLLATGTLWSLLTGVAGAILAGLWALTDHTVAARNENVLQATLFALVVGIVLPAALRDRSGAVRTARVFGWMVGGLSLLGVLLKVIPAFDQVNGQVLALFVPANLGLALAVERWARGAGGV